MKSNALRFWSMRLPMTFLLIGLFLGWEMYKSLLATMPAGLFCPWR